MNMFPHTRDDKPHTLLSREPCEYIISTSLNKNRKHPQNTGSLCGRIFVSTWIHHQGEYPYYFLF
jgi:hypothetical protein